MQIQVTRADSGRKIISLSIFKVKIAKILEIQLIFRELGILHFIFHHIKK